MFERFMNSISRLALPFHRIRHGAAAGLIGILGLFLVAGAEAKTLKIATVVPDGSSWMQEMRQAAKEIKTRTNGRVKLKFYPGGIMGNEQTVLRKMRVGQLHGGAFTTGALAPSFPDVELYSLPMLFRSYEEVDYLRERLDGRIIEGLEEAGLVPLAIGDNGFAYILSKQPIRRVSDFGGKKVWILENDIMSRATLNIAGVSPVPLSLADVYTGLQTGLIDTVAGPPMGVIAFQWHTKVKYLTDVPLMYLVGIFAIDKRAFSKLSLGDQAILREVVAATNARLDADSRASEKNAMEALKKQGIEFVSATSPEEIERWRRITQEAEAELRKKKIYSEDLFEEIHRILEEYRAQHAQ